MEIITAISGLKKLPGIVMAAFVMVLFLCNNVYAQEPVKIYTVKDGKMYIEISKNINEASLDSFIAHFDLADLALKYFIKTDRKDSLQMLGWHLDKNDDRIFSISKPLISAEDLTNIAGKIVFMEKQPGADVLFPAINNGLLLGYNRFRNKRPFATRDSITTFYLQNNKSAGSVKLAGSFTNWETNSISMTRTDSGWIADVKMAPGKYWYKFIVDGNWKSDDNNILRENDGKGNINSVFYKTNYTFRLNDYADAKKVYLAGSFNNWQPKDLQLQRTATGWELPVYIAEGTHTYKFIVDGNWKVDPANPDRYPNEFNDYNSVIHLGPQHIFRLAGYENAQQVLLTGSFNGWRKDELFMTRTDSGWILPYTLGPGNYEYRFIVDHKEITDPANPLLTSTNKKDASSFLILDPNYTFRLKGHPDAKAVFLAGDFNNYSPNSFAMKKDGNEWVYTVHLTRGKHIYKFVVDGEWIRDPENKLWEQNQYGTGDSVMWFGVE